MNELSLLPVAEMCVVIFALIFLLKRLKQPYQIAYILAGILLGPYMLHIFSGPEQTAVVGEIGILLLMFFLGMEINVPGKQSHLVKPLIAQGTKMILGFGFALLIGSLKGWSIVDIIMLSVLFVFNSTAVVSEYLKRSGELHSDFGTTILNILITQDILLAPVLTLFQFLGNKEFHIIKIIVPLTLSLIIFLILKSLRNHKGHGLFTGKLINDEEDHDFQVFAGAAICLSFGVLAELNGLSGSVGSFIAGMIIGRLPAFSWLEHSLKPFKVFFVSLFFVSVGLRLDISYLKSNYAVVFGGTFFILFSNCVLSALVFRLLRYDWEESFYGGALLSQTGEFGILALTVGHSLHVIEEGLFKAGIAITALSLLLSTIWIGLLRGLTNRWRKSPLRNTGRILKQAGD
ncbi:cation:proton antiporter [Chitinophaga sp. OAE865]|uniref:cation:proton antiporter domain-containing protein n=1 Tax=Chitinophaga sp. OAE865 TaxID=2817898 RepID=UPI001AE34506